VPITVAIVDAYNNPDIESDLETYSSTYGLPPCTSADGCFSKVNQEGEEGNYPEENSGWDGEIALDVETVHAVCQSCSILLVEANSEESSDLEQAVRTAAASGAAVISNSYAGPESGGSSGAYDEPGQVVVASSGDHQYKTEFPASSPDVVAVGGTTLEVDQSGDWVNETVWDESSRKIGTGSGCSAYFSAQEWQISAPAWESTGCGDARAVADVSADANPDHGGLLVYDTAAESKGGPWTILGGTSLSAPIIAGAYALAGGAHGVGYPASDLYAAESEAPETLHDITEGSNGSCGGRSICQAGPGYDGPTGVGTPDGLGAFTRPELPIAEPGWQVHSFATDFLYGDCEDNCGPLGVAFGDESNLYVADGVNGMIYRFGPLGGVANLLNQLTTVPIGFFPVGLAFGKDGRLYAAINGESKVVELDPATGTVLRTIAEISSPLGIATDPVSGDLMVDSSGSGEVVRISNPSSESPTVSTYTSGLLGPDGISAAPDGTFYIEDEGEIYEIAGTSAADPGTATPLVYVPTADGVAVAANPLDISAPPFVAVNANDGTITEVKLDAGSPTTQYIATGGTRGDLITVGPDGCLYATQTAAVIKVSESSGYCPFAPISPFQPPLLLSSPLGPLTANSAVLQATVNPGGAATEYHFEYGLTVAYGSDTPEQSAGSGTEPEVVSSLVTGLEPNTVYHFRVVAHSQAGTQIGSDNVLTTPGLTSGGSGQPPVDQSLPAIDGPPYPGQRLSCSPGVWSQTNVVFSYSWVLDSRTSVASTQQFIVPPQDLHHTIACIVTATDATGTGSAESPSELIQPASVKLFTIRISVGSQTRVEVLAHGLKLTLKVPEACRVRVQLVANEVHNHETKPIVIAHGIFTFRKAGVRNDYLAIPRSARRVLQSSARLRVAAVATAAGAGSKPSAQWVRLR